MTQFDIYDHVVLTPKTKKGKERLEQAYTNIWEVTKLKRNKVAFSSNDGPWLFLIPISGETHLSRWVHQHDDENFTVETANKEKE